MRKIGILSLRARRNLMKRMRTLVFVLVAQRPIDEHRVDRGVRGHDRRSVRRGRRLDHLDTAALHLLHQRPYRATFGGRIAELVVDDERSHAHSVGASLNHVSLLLESIRNRDSTGRTCLRPVVDRTEPLRVQLRRNPAMHRCWLSARSTASRNSSSPCASPSAYGSCVNCRSRHRASSCVPQDRWRARISVPVAEERVDLALLQHREAGVIVRNRLDLRARLPASGAAPSSHFSDAVPVTTANVMSFSNLEAGEPRHTGSSAGLGRPLRARAAAWPRRRSS